MKAYSAKATISTKAKKHLFGKNQNPLEVTRKILEARIHHRDEVNIGGYMLSTTPPASTAKK